MGTPIILSLNLNPHETSMACFIGPNSAPKTALSTVACLFVYQMMHAIFDEETESCVGSLSDFSTWMIRGHKSSQNDWFSSWVCGIVRYSLLNIPIEICSICLVENPHVNFRVGWIQCQY